MLFSLLLLLGLTSFFKFRQSTWEVLIVLLAGLGVVFILKWHHLYKVSSMRVLAGIIWGAILTQAFYYSFSLFQLIIFASTLLLLYSLYAYYYAHRRKNK